MAMKLERDPRGLTPVQSAFVDAYAGNVVEAARLIGFSEKYCQNMMSKPEFWHVRQAIRDRVNTDKSGNGEIVASRLERLAFWTDVMRGNNAEVKDRLKASELLGKAHMDFVEKTVVETSGQVQVSVVRGLEERIAQLTVAEADWLE